MIDITRAGPRAFNVRASGIWTVDYVDDHFGQLEAMLSSARTTGGGVQVLVDLREALVQPAATAERVRFWTERIYRSTDQVAIVVSSRLLAMQMRRVAIVATREIFTDPNAAEEWLRP